MNKDVIYIDVDDDVTAIIGKIKASTEKIIALVPPKRAGVLQSAVNLRLLDRMAKSEKKKLVLITNNQALVALAATAKIPVAKNLQSKPEVAPISALKVDDDDDIIDGSELPVGEHAKTTKIPVTDKKASVSDIDVAGLDIEGEDVAASKSAVKAAKSPRKSPKIPNFDTFRKKLIWIISGGVVLTALLVWMFVFAPAATIVITASTSAAPVNTVVKLSGTQTTSVSEGVLQAVMQSEESSVDVDFAATGEKDIGEKASGTVTIRNCDFRDGFTIAAGTSFTAAGGKVFTSTARVSVPGFTSNPSVCRNSGAGAGTAAVAVQANGAGESYNIGAASYIIAGVSGDVFASGAAMTGGTTKVVKIVTEEDVARATEKLTEQSSDSQKNTLAGKFTKDQVVIQDSFTVTKGEATANPAVGKEAPNGQAKLSVKTTVSMQAVAEKELERFLEAYLKEDLDDAATQKVYSTGASAVTFSSFAQNNDIASVTLKTNGRIGPKIDEAKVKENARGQRYGDVQQSLSSIAGVKDVDTQFSYFWVTKVPNNVDKITIEFKVNENDR